MSAETLTEAEQEAILSAHVHISPRDLMAAVDRIIADRTAALTAERDGLVRWKAEATQVMEGLHDVGPALGLPLGVLVTGPVAVEAAQKLAANLAAARSERDAALHSQAATFDLLMAAIGEPDSVLARIKADALREAAHQALASPSTRVGDLHPGTVWAAWLNSRADSIEREAGQ